MLSKIVCRVCLWNNRYQVRSKSKDVHARLRDKLRCIKLQTVFVSATEHGSSAGVRIGAGTAREFVENSMRIGAGTAREFDEAPE